MVLPHDQRRVELGDRPADIRSRSERQTIGNQIVALGNGDLVNVMTVFTNDNRKARGGTVAVLRSTNRGTSWSGQINISRLGSVGVTDPEDGHPCELATSSRRSPQTSAPETTMSMWSGRMLASTTSSVTRSRSHDPTDGGLTWSTPVRISTHNETQAFTPRSGSTRTATSASPTTTSATTIRIQPPSRPTYGSPARQRRTGLE